jgi:hypothetical protein
MKGHLKHLLMCSPMILVGFILIAGGANVLVAFLPVLGCVAMMWMMMRMAGGMGHHHGGRDRPDA